MRMYAPYQATLQALQSTNIKVILDVPNDKLQSLASDPSTAMEWVQTNVVPFASSIKYIAVGNEIHPSDQEASSVQPAMQNVLNALKSNNLDDQIKVSTSIDTSLITNSYPPSNGQFSDISYVTPIINFLTSNGSPLLVNIYPYFSYRYGNKQDITLDYALFKAPGNVVTDSNNNLNYQNLFDAMVDSVYAALGKAGAPNTAVVVSETGWPSDGDGDAATVDNAGTYYRNLINHVNQGTPLKAGQAIETYLFEMFDENKKPNDETERHFGLFFPDQHPKYGQINFS